MDLCIRRVEVGAGLVFLRFEEVFHSSCPIWLRSVFAAASRGLNPASLAAGLAGFFRLSRFFFQRRGRRILCCRRAGRGFAWAFRSAGGAVPFRGSYRALRDCRGNPLCWVPSVFAEDFLRL